MYIKNALTGNWHSSSTSYLGSANQKEAQTEFTTRLQGFQSSGTAFKKVTIPKAFVTPVAQKRNEIAQVSVRGKVGAAKPDNGYTLFSKQPAIPGLEVYVSKISSNIYAKIKHKASGLDLINLSNKPLPFSPSEFVNRVNNYTPFKNTNWNLPKDELFKKYGAPALVKMAQDFIGSLDSVMKDETDSEMEGGFANVVKDYLVARFTARPKSADRIKRQIDYRIQQKKLDKAIVYNYFGDPEDRTKAGRDALFKNIGLERTDDGIKVVRPTLKPNIKEVAPPKPQTREDEISQRIEKQKAVRKAADSKEVQRAPIAETNITNSLIGDYVEGINDDGSKVRGIALTQVYDKKKGASSGTILIETEGKVKTGVVKVSKMKRLLIKAPKGLVSLYNIASAERRLKTAKK